MKFIHATFLVFVSPLTFAQTSIEKENIRITLKGSLHEFRGCYEKSLMKLPNLQGTVALAWEIKAGGVVHNAKIASSTLKDRPAEECMLTVLKKLTFPEPPPGATVEVESFPFTFKKTEHQAGPSA